MKKESDRAERQMMIEAQILRSEEQDYHRRETNSGRAKAGGIIPGVASPPQSNSPRLRDGVVMTSDSSGSEMEKDSKRKKLSMQQFKWTPTTEALLEEILMRHYFDFHAAAKEFSKAINDTHSQTGDNAVEEQVYYQIDPKSLQLRWTDIEIRKYRLPQHQSNSPTRNYTSEDVSGSNNSRSQPLPEDIEDDLPPLEENPQPKPESEGKSQQEQVTGIASSDEEEGNSKIAHYTNLEELD